VAHKGFVLPDELIFRDEATSAYKKSAQQRKALSKLKEIALSQKLDGIIFYDFSRADRQIHSFYFDFYQPIVNQNPKFKFFVTTQSEEFKPRDISVKLTNLMSYVESRDKARRAMDAQKKDLEHRLRPGTSVPYGYRLKDKRLVIYLEEAYVVNFIYFMTSWGYSMSNIVDILNNAQIAPPRSVKWNKSTVENILKNEIYLGHMTWKFKSSQDEIREYTISCESIISELLFYFTRLATEIKTTVKKMKSPFLLSGLLYCHACQSKMICQNQSTKKDNKDYSYFVYRCKQCPNKVKSDVIHKFVVNLLDLNWSQSSQMNVSVLKQKLKDYCTILSGQIDKKSTYLNLVKEKYSKISQHTLLPIIKHSYDAVISESENTLKDLKDAQVIVNRVLESKDFHIYLSQYVRLSVDRLNNMEKKMLFHTFIGKLLVHPVRDNHSEFIKVDITYKVNPFVIVNESV